MKAIYTVQKIDNNHKLKSDGIVYKHSKALPKAEGDKLIAKLEGNKAPLPVQAPKDRGRTVGLDKGRVCRQNSPNPHPVSHGSKYQTSISNNKITFTGSDNQNLKNVKVKNALWAMTTDGKFLVHHDSKNFKHNFFDTDNDGFGKPLLCAGHVDINQEGKITKINNGSGHYKPNETHLRNVAQYLRQQNLLTTDCKVHDSHHGRDLEV